MVLHTNTLPLHETLLSGYVTYNHGIKKKKNKASLTFYSVYYCLERPWHIIAAFLQLTLHSDTFSRILSERLLYY